MENKREVRFLPAEVRAEEEERGAVITGYPIVFNQETDLGEWREVIEPVAMSDPNVLRDVPLMTQHEFGMLPLARSRRNNENSTMQLTPDEKGVNMRALLDTKNNPRAAEAYSAVGREDITGMSFAFIVNKETWEELDTDKPLRRIQGFARIFEVSLVTFPAYDGTSVQAASEGDALESVRAALESARNQLKEQRAREQEQERRKAALEILGK